MDDDEIDDDESDADSTDSFTIDEVLEMVIDVDDSSSRLAYLCRTSDGAEEIFDRSDLIDGALHQKMVLQFERRNPPPWDEECSFCDGEGCEECICEDCERPCRHINGINYGCVRHPVV